MWVQAARGRFAVVSTFLFSSLLFSAGAIWAQVPDPQVPSPDPQVPQSQGVVQAPPSRYDPAIFQNRIPADQLALLSSFARKPAGELYADKQFRKLLHNVIPDCTYHYGVDTPLSSAMDKVLHGSPVPVMIREGRYVSVIGHNGPILGGRGMLWFDMQEGIALGAFYFHPTNGEPTPAVTVFSKQVKEKTLIMGQLPDEYAADLREWIRNSRMPPVTARYFITGSNRRILLEHDEDYCQAISGMAPPPGGPCLQMIADAADIDEVAAYYLEQVHYATNATAWMIGADQVAWLRLRDGSCGAGPDMLGCRIRITRERTHMLVSRGSLRR